MPCWPPASTLLLSPCLAVCGFVLEKTGSFSIIFLVTAVMYIVGTVAWNVLCSTDPQFD